MPAGLFASLAGAACEPMRKVCPVRRPRSILPGDSARRDVSGTRMLLPGPSVQHPPVPAASIAPPLPPPVLKRTQRSASRIKSHHSLRLLPASSPYCPSMLCEPFLRPAPALSPFIPHPFSPVLASPGRRIPPGSPKAKDCALNQHFSSYLGTFVQRKIIL